jgi:hypothetical protein
MWLTATRCGFRLLEIISPGHLLPKDGDGAAPGASGSGRSMVGSEQHLEYTPCLRGVWLATALDMSRGTNIKLRTAEGHNQSS